jgi:hypothetical protein
VRPVDSLVRDGKREDERVRPGELTDGLEERLERLGKGTTRRERSGAGPDQTGIRRSFVRRTDAVDISVLRQLNGYGTTSLGSLSMATRGCPRDEGRARGLNFPPVAHPARRIAAPERPPIDPRAVDQAYLAHRSRRKARAHHQRSQQAAKRRFMLLLCVLGVAGLVLVSAIFSWLHELFGF